MKSPAPRDDDVLPKILSRIYFGNFEAKDPHCQVLERFQPE